MQETGRRFSMSQPSIKPHASFAGYKTQQIPRAFAAPA